MKEIFQYVKVVLHRLSRFSIKRLARSFLNLIILVIAGTIFIASFTIFISMFIEKTISDLAFATGIMALATITLACLTYWNIRSRNKQEECDRKEQWLNEILGWAIGIAESAISRRTLAPEELWKTKLSYKFYRARSKYIGEIVSSSFKKFSALVAEVNIKLNELMEVTTEFTKRSIVGGKRLADYEAELTECVEKLITEIAKVKTKG